MNAHSAENANERHKSARTNYHLTQHVAGALAHDGGAEDGIASLRCDNFHIPGRRALQRYVAQRSK